MNALVQDFHYAVRGLIRRLPFAATVVFTLALGIGATTAMFSVANALILRPLPFERADSIVAVMNYWTRSGARRVSVSAPDFYDWRAQSRSFSAIAYYSGYEMSVSVDGAADYAFATLVAPGFFDVLAGRAAVGRLFTADEEKPGSPLAAVITDAFWKRRFNGQASAVGTTLKFRDRLFTVVGVLPPGVRYPERADIYYPAWVVPETTSRSAHNYRVVARLRDGVTIQQAAAEMTAISSRLEREYPTSNDGKLTQVVPLQELIVGGTSQTLYLLLGAVTLVLLISCANVANLLLARSSTRVREMVIRTAVGASRGRLVRQLLTESAVLALAGAFIGAWLARLGSVALVALAPEDFPRASEIAVDGTAFLFAVAVALTASLIFGLVPAVQMSRIQPASGLREGGKGSSTGARSGWARSAFVVAEIALAVVLVVGASLLARSLARLADVDMGFEPEQLLVLQTTVPVQSRSDAPRATAFYRDLLGDVRALPGVDAASAVMGLPSAPRSNGSYAIEGASGAASEMSVRSPQAIFNVVTPDYFRTLGVPLTRGRDFANGDTQHAPLVAIVNESLVRVSFGNMDPIGRRIQCGLDNPGFMTIVGVVADVRTNGPASPAPPELFMPYEQHPGPASALSIVVRTRADDPLTLAETVRRRIAARNPDVPVRATTMEGTLHLAAATPRFRTFLLVAFAGIALFLALAGVYAVMAYTVSQRVPELGVRLALGATRGQIMRLVLLQGVKLASGGLVLGLVLAVAFGGVVQGLLFGVTPRDPITLLAVVCAVGVAALVACYIPGRRAVRVDPMMALRSQ
jgi:putative ABC transport system permease protein